MCFLWHNVQCAVLYVRDWPSVIPFPLSVDKAVTNTTRTHDITVNTDPS
jgi:hypothetical protein